LWSIILFDFHIPEARARSLTLCQFFWLWDRWIDQEDRLNLRASVVASVVANSAARKRRKPIKPYDIIPSLRDRKYQDDDVINTPEQQVAALRMLFGDSAFEVVPTPEE
jgi:hypothetical protein